VELSPDRLHVRRSAFTDAGAIAGVQVRSWQAAYAGIVPPAHLAAMSAGERAGRHEAILAALPERAGHWVAELDGRACGFAVAGPTRDRGGDRLDTAELYALYVEPYCWGIGAGRALITRALGFLTDRGFTKVTLWVLADNARGRRFYTAAGFAADGTEQVLDLGGPVRELRLIRDLGAVGLID
jgi:GNAT superfamily N-acetyltransferase